MSETTQDPNFLAAVEVALADALDAHESIARPMTKDERKVFRAGYLAGAIEGLAIAGRAFKS